MRPEAKQAIHAVMVFLGIVIIPAMVLAFVMDQYPKIMHPGIRPMKQGIAIFASVLVNSWFATLSVMLIKTGWKGLRQRAKNKD